MKKRFNFILFLLAFIIFCSCSLKTEGIDQRIEEECISTFESDSIKEQKIVLQGEEETAALKKDLKEDKISIAATGDIMFHMPIVNSAYNGKKYDFKYIFEDIKPLIESSDIAIGNLETTIYPKRKLSGYPRFNSPIEILEGIKYAGFDVLTTANNHCADSGREGILSTVNNIKKSGMIPVGTGNTKELKYAVVERNGIKIGILSYTFSTNGIKVPKGMVNLIDKNVIKKDIDILKKKSDYIIVCIHIGTEYVMDAEPNVKKLFKEIAFMGADCIIGNHPHVPRTVEIIEINGKKVFIAYSLGNLLSSQNKPYTDIGLICKLDIKKDDKGIVSLISSDVIPVYRKNYIEKGKNLYKIINYSSTEKIDYLLEEEKEYIKNTYYDIINKSSFEVFNLNRRE
ncbi:poly-gamma-glutamate synthesis protein (capsule biosynthesis protein) [Caloramator quimbayensis]|uniref:Poly-gamma-glutamate synthesis protein (Capsule biosynthesis protein) n=1 Tax=Caloramator quimbayensis TaxID=1147123 RepID=A0A1T4XMU2_9CLOT|nr:CapA family protein [Caloramator quimbayensis]SKA90842.1 poly-gamma-glutamate synthesis protein (capsule biosynthesis protein) [Caloramator quimbayensis]